MPIAQNPTANGLLLFDGSLPLLIVSTVKAMPSCQRLNDGIKRLYGRMLLKQAACVNALNSLLRTQYSIVVHRTTSYGYFFQLIISNAGHRGDDRDAGIANLTRKHIAIIAHCNSERLNGLYENMKVKCHHDQPCQNSPYGLSCLTLTTIACTCINHPIARWSAIHLGNAVEAFQSRPHSKR